MKAAGVQVFTVGFAIVNAQAAEDLMSSCATDANHAFKANTGQQLIDVFAEIGRDLSQLRLTQ